MYVFLPQFRINLVKNLIMDFSVGEISCKLKLSSIIALITSIKGNIF